MALFFSVHQRNNFIALQNCVRSLGPKALERRCHLTRHSLCHQSRQLCTQSAHFGPEFSNFRLQCCQLRVVRLGTCACSSRYIGARGRRW